MRRGTDNVTHHVLYFVYCSLFEVQLGNKKPSSEMPNPLTSSVFTKQDFKLPSIKMLTNQEFKMRLSI